MRIEIEDGTIEDLIREALDCVDIVGQVDIEELVENELGNTNLLDGINVKELVKSAIKDAVCESEDFDDFMKMVERVEQLESTVVSLSVKYGSLKNLVQTQDDEIDIMRNRLHYIEERRSWKFWA